MPGPAHARDVELVVADTAVALADLIVFEHGAYVLDTAAIRHLVDAATTADPRYTSSTARREARTLDTQARYARWQTAYRALKQRRPQMSGQDTFTPSRAITFVGR